MLSNNSNRISLRLKCGTSSHCNPNLPLIMCVSPQELASKGISLTSQPFQMMQMQQAEQQRQQEEYARQQQMMLQQQQQQQQQQQEEYMRQQYLQQQQQQQQALMAQPTGYRSNNPFAPSSSFLSPQNNPGTSNASGLFGSSPGQQAQSSFLPVPNVSLQSPPSQPTSPMEQPASNDVEPRVFGGSTSPRPAKDDGQHAGLAGLLARGREDGLDTFGNMGNLRECAWPSFPRSKVPSLILLTNV
jgi:epsin